MSEYQFTTLSNPRINPAYKKVKEKTNQWIKQFYLFDLTDEKTCQKINQMDFSSLASLTYPTAKLEHLQIFSDYLFWIFAFDDVYENSELEKAEKIRKNVINVLENKELELIDDDHMNNLFRSFQNIFSRFQSHANKECQSRFVQHQKDYLNACLEEIKYKLKKELPAIEKYILLRKGVAGVIPCFDLMEMGKNTSNEIFNDKRIGLLIDYANNNVAWINDFFSADKEENDEIIANYVLVVEKEKGLSRDQAKNYVFNHIENELAKFDSIYQQIKSEPNKEELCSYIEGLVDWMTGHREWYKHTKRYKNQQSFFDFEAEAQKLETQILSTEINHNRSYDKKF